MNVYMSAGTYSVTDALVSEADGADFSVYGGYPAGAKGASLKARDAKSNATIFDGGGKSQIWLTKKGNVLFDGLTFQNGFSAKDNGGALVFNGTGVTGKILDCSFIGNKVTDGTNGTQYLSGGAIHVFEAKVTVENSSFSKNYGRNGGSLFTNNAKAELTVKGCTFTEDYALNTGGSINNSNGTQMIENCTFTGCYNLDGAGLAEIDKQKSTQRKNRGRMIRAALVGYTNVGKSTLMNLLAKSEVFAENKLFATLDTTVRKVIIDNLPFLLSDTVGFIRKLPTDLVDSFKSTLDEVREADLLLHIVDISHPDFEEQIEVVNKTLADIGASGKPIILVFNKIDAYTYVQPMLPIIK